MCNPNKPFQCVALLCCLAALSANAKEIPISQCPGELAVRHDIRSTVTDGWKAVDSKRSRAFWFRTFLSSGEYPTKQTEFIAPSAERERSHTNRLIAYYDDLPPSANGVRDYWMICEYSRTSVTVVKKLPQNIARCEARYPQMPTTGEEVSLRCFDKPRKKPRY
jgi:hypothetical protein